MPSLETFRHELDSHDARKLIPPATRDGFRMRASEIRNDVVTLRGAL